MCIDCIHDRNGNMTHNSFIDQSICRWWCFYRMADSCFSCPSNHAHERRWSHIKFHSVHGLRVSKEIGQLTEHDGTFLGYPKRHINQTIFIYVPQSFHDIQSPQSWFANHPRFPARVLHLMSWMNWRICTTVNVEKMLMYTKILMRNHTDVWNQIGECVPL